MDYHRMTDEALLVLLLGHEEARVAYQGHLAPLFEAGGSDGSTALRPLLITRELFHRWLAEDLTTRCLFGSPNEVKVFFVAAFAGKQQESFHTAYVDAGGRLIVVEESFRGTLTQTAVYPREIVRRALELKAASVIFAHNHPTGCAEPSRADEFLTATLKTALTLIDVRVLDHIVVGGTTTVSFAERGLL